MIENFEPEIDYNCYDVELMEKMYDVRIGGLPLALFLLDHRKTNGRCHEVSKLLSRIIEGSHTVTGEMPNIHSADKRHSWVEYGDTVYDPEEGLQWKKSSFYFANTPLNVVHHTREEVLRDTEKYFSKPECTKDSMIAFCKATRLNIGNQLYRPFLRMYLEKFEEEKGISEEEVSINVLTQMDKMNKILDDEQK